MARRLQTNANGALTFTELVWDDDEEDVSHPLIRIAELYKRDGEVLDTAERTPSWLYVNINELGLNGQLGRWEEEVNIKILDAEQNLSAGTYTFRLRATDGKEATDRTVELKVI